MWDTLQRHCKVVNHRATLQSTGMASIHPGPLDVAHDVLQDWAQDFLGTR